MRFNTPCSLITLFPQVPTEFADVTVFGLSDRKIAQAGDCVCCFDSHELQQLLSDPVAVELACIIGPLVPCIDVSHVTYIPVKRPRLALQNILDALGKAQKHNQPQTRNIHPSAYVDPAAILEDDVSIGPFSVIQGQVYLGKGVTIGSHCIVEARSHLKAGVHCDHHVVIKSHVLVGDRTYIQSHTTIGADGFGFERAGMSWLKLPHLSGVVIGSDTFIGSHVAIAAGILNPTTIESNVLIDNHVQVAHHVSIGAGSAIAGCVGIAGSTTIGKNCMIGGGTKISGHLRIVDGVQITGMTMVTKSLLSPGVYSSGLPVDTNDAWKKKIITLNRLAKREMEKTKESEKS